MNISTAVTVDAYSGLNSAQHAAHTRGSEDLNMEDILRALPHRPPMLLLDGIRSFEPPDRIVAVKTLKHDDPWFTGHFPGRPVFPGVMVIEAIAQAGAVLVTRITESSALNRVPVLLNVEQARVRKPLFPGDTVELHVECFRVRGKFWHLKGRAMVKEKVTASAELMAALVDPAELLQV